MNGFTNEQNGTNNALQKTWPKSCRDNVKGIADWKKNEQAEKYLNLQIGQWCEWHIFTFPFLRVD